jgi:uroporphyrin-III C-methyltransferase
MSGKVYLVGAGPGDPDLITVRALRLIQQADVILYDRLIPAALLDEVRPDAERVDVGKQPAKHRFSQDEINDLMVAFALAGKMVVRLKGGDPFVFGRGSEEALACHAAGIPFEVVPGISSALAVPAYAGIPLTHRNVSSGFTVITGHEDPTKPETSIQYDSLARSGHTLVILMGVKQMPDILARLMAAGLAADTPAAVIEQGTTPQQRVIEGTAGTLADLAREAAIQPPALIVVGDVVRLRAAGVDWFRCHEEQENMILGESK